MSGQELESETTMSSTLRAGGQCLVFEVWPSGTGTKPSKPFLALPTLEALEEVRRWRWWGRRVVGRKARRRGWGRPSFKELSVEGPGLGLVPGTFRSASWGTPYLALGVCSALLVEGELYFRA